MTANAVITKVAALMLTPKCRANWGSTGATTPYPSAITALPTMSDHTSRGRRTSTADPLAPDVPELTECPNSRYDCIHHFPERLCCTCARCSGPLNDSA